MPKLHKRSNLPYAPLTLSDATTVASAHVAGASLLLELDGEEALEGWNVARALFVFSTTSQVGLPKPALEGWESALLRASEANAFLTPLAVIVGELLRPEFPDRTRLCTACITFAENALERGAVRSALCFMETAALCWPENARYAMVAGRAMKNHGRLQDAERWLRRAMLLSRWFEDWPTHVLSTSSFGMLQSTLCAPVRARKHLLRARFLAHRHRLPVIEGEVLHNLLVVAITTDDRQNVVEYARNALDLYLPDHPRLPSLAYDLAYYWMRQGEPAKALSIFEELLRHFETPSSRLQVLAATARAAGACQQREIFEASWRDAFALAESAVVGVILPTALIDLGFGAAHFADWKRAGEAFTGALLIAQKSGLSGDSLRAETCLAEVKEQRNPDTLARPASREPSNPISHRFVLALREMHCAGSVP